MVLKTYSRIFTEDVEATLTLLTKLVGRGPELRAPFRDMEVVTLGDFCVVAGPAESIRPFLGAVGPVIVDDIRATQAEIESVGATIVSPITEVMTGLNMLSRTRDGVVIEYVQWTAEIWETVRSASRAAAVVGPEGAL